MRDLQTTPTTVKIVPDSDTRTIIKSNLMTSVSMDDDDPFYICDLGDVAAKHQRWKKEFPRIHPHYAIKCNPDKTMLKILMAMGLGFDCASKSEIQTMLDLGASAEQIIYANPCKQKSHIKYAREKNVKLMVFDGEHELFKIKSCYPDADLVLRIQTDDSASVCQFSMKFGAHPDSCKQLLDSARLLDLNVVGISFHVGSGCQDVGAFSQALFNSRKLFDYAKTIGYQFNLLDIGGGFPGIEEVELKFEEITSAVNMDLDKLFPEDEFANIRIIAEPGRYYAASAFTLATNVIAKRDCGRDNIVAENRKDSAAKSVENMAMPTADEEPAFMYYINDGLYGSFNCLFYDHAKVTPTLLQENLAKKQFSSSIWGPTCDGLDKIIDYTLLPELDVGDWIIWKDMGAYTVAAGSSFNGFKTSRIHYFISDSKRSLIQQLVAKPDLKSVSTKYDGSVSQGKSENGKFDVIYQDGPDRDPTALSFENLGVPRFSINIYN